MNYRHTFLSFILMAASTLALQGAEYQRPQINPVGNRNVAPGTPLTFQVSATPANNPEHRFTALTYSGPLASLVRGPGIDAYRSKPNARAYYVDSVRGNDAHDGSTPDTAWKNLSRVHALTFQPGDAIRLARGSRWVRQSLYFDDGSQGTASDPIVIEAYGEGEPPTISDPRAVWSEDRIWPGVCFATGGSPRKPAAYFHLLDIRVEDTIDAGISLATGSHHVVVAGCEVRRCGTGISICGSNHRVVSNYLHDGIMAIDTGTNPEQDMGAMGVTICGQDFEIAYNLFDNLVAESKAFGTDGAAVEFFGNTDGVGWNYVSNNVRFHHNVIRNTDCLIEGMGKITNLVIAHNLVYDNPNHLFIFHMTPHWVDGAWVYNSYGVAIENNTILHDVFDSPMISLWGGDGTFQAGHQIVVRNNIIRINGLLAQNTTSVGANLVHDHNLFHFLPRGTFGSGNNAWVKHETELVGDPQLVNPAGLDFRPGPESPASGAGVKPRYSLDLLGKRNPAVGSSLGAYLP